MLRKTLDNLPYALPYLIVTAVSVVLFYPTWIRLASEWLEFEQVLAHGLATAVIYVALLLIHPPLPTNTQAPSASRFQVTGILILLVTTLVWALLELVRIDTLTYLMLPAGLLATSWTLLGFHRALRLLPYVILLALSLPIWADVIPALVAIASAVVSNWVRLFGMTALIEGNSITLPYGRLVIADGCSGIRYFAISILLAAMMSILNDYRWRGWLCFLAAAMVLGLIANWVRIFILVVIGYQSEMQSELLTDHELMGWVIYGVFILPALYFAPVKRRTEINAPDAKQLSRKGLFAVLVALIAGPVALNVVQLSGDETSPWAPPNAAMIPGQPSELPLQLRLPDNLDHKVWATPDGAWLSVAQSERSAATDHKLVPYLRPPIDSEEWLVQETQGQVKIYQNRVGRQQVAVLQWYQVGDYAAQSYRDAKLWQIPATLSGASRFALVSVMAECEPRQCNRAIENVGAAQNTISLSPLPPENKASSQ
ncbi:exosortase/archaeosortase family protein [Marinobacter sp. UBA3607]|jgi:exosortase|uniref:exosortase/archaeosortase family protein n=1 Tax=Marinobacter sp. UBA3607 TaxID=1946820 RepID=UPI00257C7B1B|nr:exosortase/archaeosortase family protein [Marinobacter sp. UBA3607]|tara:strand:- start:2408 stop:3859 length:1452 start_codon:yes stop_codon:yes gene_type:complete